MVPNSAYPITANSFNWNTVRISTTNIDHSFLLCTSTSIHIRSIQADHRKKIHFRASEMISHSYSASHTYNLDIDILQRNRNAQRSQYYAGHYAEEARLSIAQNAKTRGLEPLPPLLLAAGSARGGFIVAGLWCETTRGKWSAWSELSSSCCHRCGFVARGKHVWLVQHPSCRRCCFFRRNALL